MTADEMFAARVAATDARVNEAVAAFRELVEVRGIESLFGKGNRVVARKVEDALTEAIRSAGISLGAKEYQRAASKCWFLASGYLESKAQKARKG